MPGSIQTDRSDSPLARVNPLAKVVGIVSFGLAALLWPDFMLGLALIVVLFALSALARILPGFSKVMLGFGLPVTAMLLLIQGCFSPRNTVVIADLGFARLGLEGSLYAAKIVVTLMVFLGGFFLTGKTTYMGCLVAALTQVGIPSKVGYLVLATLNVVPQMQRRVKVIEEAQHARGLETGGGFLSRARAFIPLLGPVVLSSLTDSQERGMTLETRGFGIKGVRRTSYLKAGWRVSDTLVTVFFLLFLVLVLAACFMDRAGLLRLAIQWGGRA